MSCFDDWPGFWYLHDVIVCNNYLSYYFARGSGCEVLWWICLSVCLFVSLWGYLQNHMRDLYQIFVHVAHVRGSVLLQHIYDRERFSSPLKMHYWPGKGDGSAQRGRSMLSTIALFYAVFDMYRVHFCLTSYSYYCYCRRTSTTLMSTNTKLSVSNSWRQRRKRN